MPEEMRSRSPGEGVRRRTAPVFPYVNRVR